MKIVLILHRFPSILLVVLGNEWGASAGFAKCASLGSPNDKHTYKSQLLMTFPLVYSHHLSIWRCKGLQQAIRIQFWKFQFKSPFDLKNVPSGFQCVMDEVLIKFPIAHCYIDDVVIFSETPHTHVWHL
jgi:hypothetical protein